MFLFNRKYHFYNSNFIDIHFTLLLTQKNQLGIILDV